MEPNQVPPEWEGVTAPEDYADTTVLVQLPVRKTRSGGPVTVRVRQVDTDVVLLALKGLPAGGETDDSNMVERVAQWRGPALAIAKAGVVVPRFGFEDDDIAYPHWKTLTFADQMAVVRGILGLSGWGSPATADLRTFPADDRSGRSDSGGAGQSVEEAPPPVESSTQKAEGG